MDIQDQIMYLQSYTTTGIKRDGVTDGIFTPYREISKVNHGSKVGCRSTGKK